MKRSVETFKKIGKKTNSITLIWLCKYGKDNSLAVRKEKQISLVVPLTTGCRQTVVKSGGQCSLLPKQRRRTKRAPPSLIFSLGIELVSAPTPREHQVEAPTPREHQVEAPTPREHQVEEHQVEAPTPREHQVEAPTPREHQVE